MPKAWLRAALEQLGLGEGDARGHGEKPPARGRGAEQGGEGVGAPGTRGQGRRRLWSGAQGSSSLLWKISRGALLDPPW